MLSRKAFSVFQCSASSLRRHLHLLCMRHVYVIYMYHIHTHNIYMQYTHIVKLLPRKAHSKEGAA